MRVQNETKARRNFRRGHGARTEHIQTGSVTDEQHRQHPKDQANESALERALESTLAAFLALPCHHAKRHRLQVQSVQPLAVLLPSPPLRFCGRILHKLLQITVGRLSARLRRTRKVVRRLFINPRLEKCHTPTCNLHPRPVNHAAPPPASSSSRRQAEPHPLPPPLHAPTQFAPVRRSAINSTPHNTGPA